MMGEAFARSAATPVDRDVASALPMLEGCFRSAVRATRARLVTRTGRDIPVVLQEVRSATALEVLSSDLATGHAVWCPFHLGRADLAGFVLLESRLLSRLVGRLFGDGDMPASFDVERTPSEVELSVGGRLCRELFASLERFWPPPHPPRFFAGDLSTARHGVSDIPVFAQMVVAEVRFGPEDAPLGFLQCILPGSLVRGMAGKKPPPATRPEASRTLNYDRLMPVEVELVVELARFELPLSALEDLQVGSELPLGGGQDVCGRVNDRVYFFGDAGVAAGVRSFKIARRVGGSSTAPARDR
jgi:flagellar motor switch protein FliM